MERVRRGRHPWCPAGHLRALDVPAALAVSLVMGYLVHQVLTRTTIDLEGGNVDYQENPLLSFAERPDSVEID